MSDSRNNIEVISDDVGLVGLDLSPSPDLMPVAHTPTTERTVLSLGAITVGESGGRVPSINVEIAHITGPAKYAAAGAKPYSVAAQKTISEIRRSPGQEVKALEYAKRLFPNSDFSFIGLGAYGIVLGDESGKAFKVYRSNERYSRCEKEAGALEFFAHEGLAPKLHMLVDADPDYRVDKKALEYTKEGFGEVQIPRQPTNAERPVLIMEKIDVSPVEDAVPAGLADGCRVEQANGSTDVPRCG